MQAKQMFLYDEGFAPLSLYSGRTAPRLMVKQSDLGAVVGDGLFAAQPIAGPGVHLCDYSGTCYSTKDAMAKKDHSYLMRLGTRKYVDAFEHTNVLARFINDCRNPALHNVKFVKLPELNKAKVVTLRPILTGEELYVDYGKWYWAGFSGKPKKLSIKSTCELLEKVEHLLKLRDQDSL